MNYSSPRTEVRKTGIRMSILASSSTVVKGHDLQIVDARERKVSTTTFGNTSFD